MSRSPERRRSYREASLSPTPPSSQQPQQQQQQQPQQQIRRTSMTEDEERDRRASIREIMQDKGLTELERRRSIQSLMDGRRRSSGGVASRNNSQNAMSLMAAAAAAAAEFYDSSDDDDEDNIPMFAPQDVSASSLDDSLSQHSGRTSRSGGSSRSRRNSGNYPRKGRSASLKAFANGAAVAVAAAAAAAASLDDDPEDVRLTAQRMERCRPVCEHYKRNCTIISPCCGLAFGCRICHDECPVLPPPMYNFPSSPQIDWDQDGRTKTKLAKRPSLPTTFDEEETHHPIDRFAIKEVICRKCYQRQPAKSNKCISCNIQFGEYHCSICNLWMSLEEDPYHCLDCGFCRVGGRENFTHCHDCGMCIDALLFDDHNCKAGKYMSNCPVCQEDLFSSRSASHEMPCGHAIHWHCFKELTSFDTRCPVCKKTAETHDQMAPTWSAMAMGIALQPVPPEMARVVTILCNDCEAREEDRRWHFLGVQCQKCMSFNTTIESTRLTGRAAAAFLGDDPNADHPAAPPRSQQQQQQQQQQRIGRASINGDSGGGAADVAQMNGNGLSASASQLLQSASGLSNDVASANGVANNNSSSTSLSTSSNGSSRARRNQPSQQQQQALSGSQRVRRRSALRDDFGTKSMEE